MISAGYVDECRVALLKMVPSFVLPSQTRWNRYKGCGKARKCSLKIWFRSCRFRASLRSCIISPILFSIFVVLNLILFSLLRNRYEFLKTNVIQTLVLLAGRIALQQGQLPLFSEQDNPAAFASDFKSRYIWWPHKYNIMNPASFFYLLNCFLSRDGW